MLEKIMVAMDESAASDWAFDLALEIAGALNSGLMLVHVLDVYSPAAPQQPRSLADSSMESNEDAQKEYERRWEEFVDRHNALLQQHCDQAKAVGTRASYDQPHGHPGPTLSKIAKQAGVDLIIVGSHDPSTMESSVLGSVSNYLVHHAPCSVTVVHENNKEGLEIPADRLEFAPVGSI